MSGEEITQCLIAEGFHPPKRLTTLKCAEVQTLMRRLGFGTRRTTPTRAALAEHEWWLPDLALALEMPEVTLYNWVRRGWVRARQQSQPPHHWIIWSDASEYERLKTYRQYPPGQIQRQRWQGEVPAITIPPTEPNLC